MQILPYLMFDGRCEEAINFYRSALGAEVQTLMRFKENPMQSSSPECANIPPEAVMHASLRIGDTTVMASDGRCGGKPKFEGISLSYSLKTEAEADRVFAALAEGGQVQMPMMKTFFSPRFGMVADRFGVSWMVIVGQ